MLRQIRLVENLIRAGAINIEVTTIEDRHIFDALRQGVFRITALGITGFDTPLSNELFAESKASLEGIETAVLYYEKDQQNTVHFQQVVDLLAKSKKQLETNPDKNSFDYLTFIEECLNPLSIAFYEWQVVQNIPFVERYSVLKSDARSLFDAKAFNADAVLDDVKLHTSERKVDLGKKLFYDNMLSGNNTRSCASCHLSQKAFSDGLKVATDLSGSPLLRNTPSLNYAGFYHGMFWDMRSPNLESLTTNVIQNKDEMHGELETIVKTIRKDEEYRTIFKDVFETEEVEVWQIQNALAAYIRSLSVFNSRFDQYMNGDKSALSQKEKLGFNLFVGKAKCATCHFLPVFNGTVPPSYTSSEQEVLGVPADAKMTILDKDLGRQYYNMSLEQLSRSFKTPTVRNVEFSAPYMHNGVFATLDEVVHFYNEGGGLGVGLEIDNQTLPEDKLLLSDEEKQALIAFMKALSDK